jgi:SNF family Na+-dependent transporter
METSALGSIIAVAMILSGIVSVILGVVVILVVWKHRKDGTAKVTASNPLLLLALVTIFVSMPLLQAANRMDHGNVTLLGFVALTFAGLAWAICCFSLVAIFVKRMRERRGENR